LARVEAVGAAGAERVLDHDLCAERARHVLADDTGDDIGRSAGRERHDQRDVLGRIVLRACRRGNQQRDQRARQEIGNLHGHHPSCAFDHTRTAATLLPVR
jgi:hypothetical protein